MTVREKYTWDVYIFLTFSSISCFVGLTTIMRKAVFYIFPLLLFSSAGCFASSPLYLEREIRSALTSRDDYYRQARVNAFLFPFAHHDAGAADSLRAALVQAAPDTTPWYYFLSGIAAAGVAPDSVRRYFKNALSAAGNSPAMVWTLAEEFGRCGQSEWERQCLQKLEKIFLGSGATSAAVIAQPLLLKALRAEGRGDNRAAADYYVWAQIFDDRMLWPSLRRLRAAFPAQLSKMVAEVSDIAAKTAHSWPLQLTLALYGALWLRWCMIIFIVGLALVLGIRHGPSMLHWLLELLPAGLPHATKLYFSVLLFASLLSFGLLPFLWLLVASVWKYCTKRDRPLARVLCVLLILYPFCIRCEDMARQCLSPQGTPALFLRAMREGYDPEVDKIVSERASNDYLAYASKALCALKKNDLASASFAMKKAQLSTDDDPAVLLTGGIVASFSGDSAGAKKDFETCAKLYPGYEPAFFNLGQYYLGANETVKGMEYIDRATKLDQASVNSFIQTNDDFFSKKWPRLRQFMPGDYQAGFFWKNVFPRYWGSWKTADHLWGTAFLGVPLAASSIIFIVLFMLLLVIDSLVLSNHGAVKIFLCKLCGAAMCRECKKGMVCSACFQAIQQIRNENIRQRIIERIVLKNRRIKLIFAHCLDVVFPGCGMLYRDSGHGAAAWLYMILTAMVYASFITLKAVSFSYPVELSRDLLLPLLYTMPLYTIVFGVKALIAIKKELRS